MSALTTQPTNLNYLSPAGFRFRIERIPNVNYFCQSVSLPGVTMGAVNVATPFGIVPQTGDRIEFEQLDLHFKVDEDLSNWIEMYDWMQALARNPGFETAREFSRKHTPSINREGTAASFKSDATLQILTSHKNANLNVFFRDCFPITLSGLSFDSTQESINYLTAQASFRYRRFDIERI